MGKCFYHGPDKVKAKHVMKLSRHRLARFVRIISGHNSLFYFRSLIDPDTNSICRFCLEEDETFFHLATECPRFRLTRQDKFLDMTITNDHMWSVDALINFSYMPGINGALEGEGRIPRPCYDSPDISEIDDPDESSDRGESEEMAG